MWSNVEKYGPVMIWLEEGCPPEDGGELPAGDANLDPSDDYPDDGDAPGELC